ncbi:proline-rich protein 5 isoform X1 [Artibeus jamaicensis]|uniref:proline-rich protein 5 isoform X1 n=1 Tax=Artibeus jamaicensis TaxID=9417 RepID=UPI00235B26FF|nr:proline-rich protein 5 isoform X1 [Artibeus jamaicensis]
MTAVSLPHCLPSTHLLLWATKGVIQPGKPSQISIDSPSSRKPCLPAPPHLLSTLLPAAVDAHGLPGSSDLASGSLGCQGPRPWRKRPEPLTGFVSALAQGGHPLPPSHTCCSVPCFLTRSGIGLFGAQGGSVDRCLTPGWWVRTEAAGLTGGDVGLLLRRRAAHAAGRLLSGAGQGAVRAPAGPAALPEHHHPQREAGGGAGPRPRPRASRHRADAAGAPGCTRVPGCDQGLPAPGDADPEGGVALPGHLRPLLRRGLLLTLLHPGETLPAPRPLRGHPGQEPGGTLQELQHTAAEPCGGARGGGCGGRRHQHPQALGLRDDVLPGRAGPGPCRGLHALPGPAAGALPQQTVPGLHAVPRGRPCLRLPTFLQPREPGGPGPGVRGLGLRRHLH